MLHRLTIHNRSAQELRQLAADRRAAAAASKEGKSKALLLQEVKLLECYAELRDRETPEGGRPDDGSADDRSASEGMRSGDDPQRGLPGSGFLASQLTARLALSPADRQAFLAAAAAPREAPKGECLVEEGSENASLIVLCHGMARAVRVLADGSQQIVAIFVAGDMLNAGDLTFRRSRASISALTSVISLSIPLPALNRLMDERPAIARALWRETANQAAIQQEWMIGLGRRTAQARLAHFLCEMSCRQQPFNPDAGDGFDLPLTQQDLGDALGLSTVHVNRVLQSLRGDGLIEFNRGWLEIRDKAGLFAAAEFDQQYLSGLMCPEVEEA
jgi:CRP-like cAMP-binding protein